MKAMLLPPMFLLAATVSQARTIAFNTACGTVEVQRVMCVTAPCPYGFFKMKTNSGFRLGLIPVNDAMEAQLIEASRYQGKRYCAQGELKNRSEMTVEILEPVAPADH